MSRRFPYRLRTARKRSGFAQHEVAELLDFDTASVISRFEWGERQPDVRTALAYRILFRRPVEELFPGQYAEARALLAERASRLAERLRQGEVDRRTHYKLKQLDAVIAACREDHEREHEA